MLSKAKSYTLGGGEEKKKQVLSFETERQRATGVGVL